MSLQLSANPCEFVWGWVFDPSAERQLGFRPRTFTGSLTKHPAKRMILLAVPNQTHFEEIS